MRLRNDSDIARKTQAGYAVQRPWAREAVSIADTCPNAQQHSATYCGQSFVLSSTLAAASHDQRSALRYGIPVSDSQCETHHLSLGPLRVLQPAVHHRGDHQASRRTEGNISQTPFRQADRQSQFLPYMQ